MIGQPTFPTPPSLPGIHWREGCVDDVPALHALQVAAQYPEGPLDQRAGGEYEKLFAPDRAAVTTTLCALDESGDIVAFGSASVHSLPAEHRAYLDGMVHPRLRRQGVGTFLLQWAEDQGRRLLTAHPPDRSIGLHIDFMDRRDDAPPLYEKLGFRFRLAEDTMRRDLHEFILPLPPPTTITLTAWNGTQARQFYEAYEDAFRQRPGFPGWSENVWRESFTGSSGFRPDLSLLVSEGEVPVGYVLCAVEGEKEGLIEQMGVRPAWRGRGVGAALLSTAIHAFQREGLDAALLDVNVNNPGAQRLYERLGFRVVARRVAYMKSLGPDAK